MQCFAFCSKNLTVHTTEASAEHRVGLLHIALESIIIRHPMTFDNPLSYLLY